jgi:hypothetical protein
MSLWGESSVFSAAVGARLTRKNHSPISRSSWQHVVARWALPRWAGAIDSAEGDVLSALLNGLAYRSPVACYGLAWDALRDYFGRALKRGGPTPHLLEEAFPATMPFSKAAR